MRQPETGPFILRASALLMAVLAVAGCGGGSKGIDSSRAGLGGVAPVYVARDGAEVRRLHEYQNLVTLAGAELGTGNLAAAETRARSAQKLFPDRPDALVLLAAVADRRGDAAEAGRLLERSATLAPDRGDVLNNYGAWLCERGRAAESLAWLDRAVAAPGYATPEVALSNAGACALQAGEGARAERALRGALARAPRDPRALESMARLSFEQGSFMEARAFAERRLAAAPATRSVLQLASQIEARLGDPRAAERYLQRIRQEFPQEAGTNSKG